MALSKLYEYLEVVLYIAIHSGATPVISKDICNFMDVKPRHLEPTMKQLVKGGILKGTKGPKGGYSLAKEKRKITLLDIYKSLQVHTTSSNLSDNAIYHEVIEPLSEEIDDYLFNKFQQITLDHLVTQVAASKEVNNTSEEFNI